MKTFSFFFLMVCTVLFSSNRDQDLKVIVEKSYLDSQFTPVLNMVALQAIQESNKKIEPEKLVELFRSELSQEKNLVKMFEPYVAIFSDKEIEELRKVIENPTWQKMMKEGGSIVQAHMQTVRNLFQELADDFAAEVRAASTIFEATKENFDELIASNKPIILDINASWCAPCKSMEPIFEDLSNEYQGRIQFAKIDFDSQRELAKEFGVTSLPTILFIKPGERVPAIKNIGFLAKKDFEAKIEEFVNSL